LIVYFDLSSTVTVLSSGPWNLTNCHDVPLSGFPPLDFCATAEVNKAETMTTLANINVLRLALVFIEAAFLSIRHFG